MVNQDNNDQDQTISVGIPLLITLMEKVMKNLMFSYKIWPFLTVYKIQSLVTSQ